MLRYSRTESAESCLYGQRTSGFAETPSLFAMTVPTGNNWISGGDYGVEGGIFTTIVIIAALLALLRSRKVRGIRR